jgi:hypothetical protein
MPGRTKSVAKSAATRCLCAAGCFIKKALRPAPETVVAGADEGAGAAGEVISVPVRGGLHCEYRRAAQGRNAASSLGGR